MVSRRMASWRMASRRMAALQIAIAVYRSGRFGFGRPGTVPCRGAVYAFLRTCILAWNGFLHSMHGRDVCVPQCTVPTLGGLYWQQAQIPCLDSANSKRIADLRSVGNEYGFYMDSTFVLNWQLATGNKYAPHIHPSGLYSTDTSQADESSCIPQRFVGLTTQGRAPNLRRSAAESARRCRRRPAHPARWRRRRRRRRPAGRPAPGSCRRPGRPARCP